MSTHCNFNHLQMSLNNQVPNGKLINIPFSNALISPGKTILTPTSPESTSPFYLSPSFQQFSYATSPINCDISPPLNIPTIDYLPEKSPSAVDNENNFCDFSFVDTPDSVFSSNPPSSSLYNNNSNNDDVFKFEPEHIERIQQSFKCNKSNLSYFEAEYFNYDEINCQSKTQSPCTSPSIDPWLCVALNGCSASPKQNNIVQTLPSIKTFSTVSQFHSCDTLPIPDFYDINFLDECTQPTSDPSHEYIQDNYNVGEMEKPNREFKNIWTQDCENNDNFNASDDLHTSTLKIEDVDPCGPLECRWADCFEIFPDQNALVKHIEKRHVEQKKGDEFSCFWLDCVRQNKPFNARYKLLIHMRVHSGEKPNKCPRRTSIQVSIRRMQKSFQQQFRQSETSKNPLRYETVCMSDNWMYQALHGSIQFT
ncbi:Zinc finger protein [Pseudolycoriella hygida]|uniref:Zinc finger protein n=1 Tax=Pseudolycoriella hygida TaxID=35572 RepID=A0A9Q0S1G0_9DIPT|nr:Zinc finger protein [Pseudolycoriella hygida]